MLARNAPAAERPRPIPVDQGYFRTHRRAPFPQRPARLGVHSYGYGVNCIYLDIEGNALYWCAEVTSGAGGARTHDRRIMRSPASCTVHASCTDTTEPCRQWP